MNSSSSLMNSTDSAYTYIKNRILEGIYKPSEKLVETQLAKEIGVSRNTLKNALLILEKENLIEIEKNKGAKIKSFSLEEIKNFLEIREALEGIIAKTAAANISNENIGKLESILNQMKCLLEQDKFDDYSQMNKVFHQVIYDCSKNQQAVEMVLVIKAQLTRYHFRTILIPGRTKSSLEEHTEIVEALKARDPERADAALRNHIAHVRKTVESYYQFLI